MIGTDRMPGVAETIGSGSGNGIKTIIRTTGIGIRITVRGRVARGTASAAKGYIHNRVAQTSCT